MASFFGYKYYIEINVATYWNVGFLPISSTKMGFFRPKSPGPRAAEVMDLDDNDPASEVTEVVPSVRIPNVEVFSNMTLRVSDIRKIFWLESWVLSCFWVPAIWHGLMIQLTVQVVTQLDKLVGKQIVSPLRHTLFIWSNYSDPTRPHSQWWLSKGNFLISVGRLRGLMIQFDLRIFIWVVATQRFFEFSPVEKWSNSTSTCFKGLNPPTSKI